VPRRETSKWRAALARRSGPPQIVNALLPWLTSWVAGKLPEPFHITGFWGAIIVGLVSWLLSITLCDKRPDRGPSWPPFLTSAATGRSAGPPWPGPYGNSPHPG
jgi:hypothetical protein